MISKIILCGQTSQPDHFGFAKNSAALSIEATPLVKALIKKARQKRVRAW